MSSHGIGAKIQQWRLARGLSQGALAQRAGISGATLSRWEAGRKQPRLAELEAVLNALHLTQMQRGEALHLLDVPRAVQQVRQQMPVSMPVTGDLLRAMRLRKGWTQAETASKIGVSQGRLVRWEKSEDWPSAERLHALCYALEARPEEVEALTCQRCWLAPPENTACTPETLDHELHQIMWQQDHTLTDLQFAMLEARLWQQAFQQEDHALLLGKVYTARARLYNTWLRDVEAGDYAARALKIIPGRQTRAFSNYWLGATAPLMLAKAQVKQDQKSGARKAVRLLCEWIPRVENQVCRSWMLGELSVLLAQSGDREEAQQVSERACREAAASDDPTALLFRRREQAVALLKAEKPAHALDTLENTITLMEMGVDPAIRHNLLFAEARLALKQPTQAQDHLHTAFTLLQQDNRAYLYPLARALATRF